MVVPVHIMVLHPTKLTALPTTSSFVVAVAICLAIYMEDSQPKDVVACIAAYSAVLVLFVGVHGAYSAHAPQRPVAADEKSRVAGTSSCQRCWVFLYASTKY